MPDMLGQTGSGDPRRSVDLRAGARAVRSRGVTLVDVLVSISVISLLIGLMVPVIASVRDVANRTVCSSNVRQIGLGVVMYADQHNGRMPPTAYVPVGADSTLDTETVILRRSSASPVPPTVRGGGASAITMGQSAWDGIGILFRTGYLDAAGVFYCPSHEGEATLENYREAWSSPSLELVGNYQFRGLGPDGSPYLYRVEPRNAAILSDAFRSIEELNHEDGANVLHADLRVTWFDSVPVLPEESDSISASRKGREIWRTYDGGGPTDTPTP